MPRTQIDGRQVEDGSIQRKDLDVSTPGQATITKVLAGTKMSSTKTGADVGTGDVTMNFVGPVDRNDLNVAETGKAVVRKIIAGTGIALNSTGADSGTGDVTVNLDFGLVLLEVVVPANTQSVVLAGFDFPTHLGYTLQSSIINPAGSASYRMQLDGTDGGTFDLQNTDGAKTNGSNLQYTRQVSGGYRTTAFVQMLYEIGYFWFNTLNTTSGNKSEYGGGRRAIASPPTSITITGSVANSIGAGSVFRVFRRK